MSNPDSFTKALTQGLADLRDVLEEATQRFESDMQRMREASATSMPETLPTSAQDALGQMERLVQFLRSEAARSAGEVSEGIAGVVEEVSRFVYTAMPGLEEQIESAGASFQRWVNQMTEAATGTASSAPIPTTAVAKKPAASGAKKAAKKKATKKKAAKKATKKKAPAKKKAAKKTSAKNTSAKKAPAKKATKKKAAKKATKKATKKAPATKKATKKASGS